MSLSPHLIILAAMVISFVILLRRDAGLRTDPAGAGEAGRIVTAGLASITIGGLLGLAWFALSMLVHDGVMGMELTICAALVAILAAITAGGLRLRQRGRGKTAAVLLAVGAVPVILGFAFLLYLESAPIDMR